MIMQYNLPSFKRIQDELLEILNDLTKESDDKEREKKLEKIIESSNYAFDILLSFFVNESEEIKKLVEEIYIRKTYSTFSNKFLNFKQHKKFRSVVWEFSQNQSSDESINKKDGIVGSASISDIQNLVKDTEGFIFLKVRLCRIWCHVYI
jgi:hypothetical protein